MAAAMETMPGPDWYAVLRLAPDASAEEIASAVERLSRQASALATTAPERSQQLRETLRSIKRDLLSGPENRQRYDQSRAHARNAVPPQAPAASTAPAAPAAQRPLAPQYPAAPVPPAAPAPASAPAAAAAPASAAGPGPEGMGARFARFMRTGWACSNCGKGSLPNEKFCSRCGSPIQPPAPATAARAPAVRNPVCANCGKQLRSSDVFCGSCGTRRADTP
jgi:translation initiation factor IF-2